MQQKYKDSKIFQTHGRMSQTGQDCLVVFQAVARLKSKLWVSKTGTGEIFRVNAEKAQIGCNDIDIFVCLGGITYSILGA